MNRRLVALAAALVLLVSGVTPGAASMRSPDPAAAAGPVSAAPASPTDESKVPHYFGPYPNWANSQLTLPDVAVKINGDGSGATAAATVGANGAVTGITITNPGSGYTAATVDLTGAGTGATASAVVTLSSAVTAVNVTNGGSGYTAPTVTLSGGGSAAAPVTTPSVTPTATDTYKVTRGSATGGTFTLTVDGKTTAGIVFNATAAQVDLALAIAKVPSSTTGTGTIADPWVIVFDTAPGAVLMDPAGLTRGGVADTSVVKGATPGTWTASAGSATGGVFVLIVDGATSTAGIAWNAAAADVAAALLVAGFTTTATGSGAPTDPWVIVFATAPAAVGIDPAGLTRGVADTGVTSAAADTFTVSAGSATGGAFTLAVDGGPATALLAWNASAADVEAALGGPALVSVTGTAPSWTIVFFAAPATGVTIDATGLTQGVPDTSIAKGATPGTWTVSAGSATGGTFKLTVDTKTTAAIAFDATAPNVDAALLAAGFTTSTAGTGTLANPWVIVFDTAPASVNLDPAGLTQAVTDSGVTPAATRLFSLTIGSADGGTYKLVIDGTPTSALAWNATAGNIQAAISGSVVTGTGPFTIKLAAAPASFTVDDTLLTQTTSTPTAQATGTAYGGVDAVSLSVDGVGYRFPTVDFDLPDDPNGVQAKGVAVCDSAHPDCKMASDTDTASVIGVVVTDPGSGYATAPGVVVRNGTQFDPIIPGPTFKEAKATATLTIQSVVLDTFGSGYTSIPTVTFADKAVYNVSAGSATGGTFTLAVDGAPNVGPFAWNESDAAIQAALPGTTVTGGTGPWVVKFGVAPMSFTMNSESLTPDATGAGVTPVPPVPGSGAAASATTAVGSVTAINLTAGGSGYIQPGIKKFEDALPGLCLPPACPTTGKYIPLAVAEDKAYNGVSADEYVIGLIQYKTNFSSSLPDTLVRGYIQLETPANAGVSQHWPVTNTLPNETQVPVLKADGTQWFAVTPPQWLGPTIGATKDKAVRIEFHNLLPTGMDGNLFLPVDSTLMGSGMGPNLTDAPVDAGTVMDGVRNPMCTEMPNMKGCYAQNRATLHLHGGTTPWISDGTPHQWITPAGEVTDYPQGVSVQNVPDMDVCNAADDGCQTFYYTNQQSARLMFYHDHAWGITRLNVYAGEAAGYVITDDTEKKLIKDGTIPGAADTIPLVVQDRTFVPDAAQLALQDPTWDSTKWGTKGSFWYHHVYMPAQNPGDPSGMSAYGRWMYGPWFWPPAAPQYPPIANPYYDPACDLNDPSTWAAHGYLTDPFCEPKEIPGTPNISVGMEQFNDTPIVNGVAYPTITLEPKSYRLRMLNAANDRFMNFQWYVGEASTASTGTNTKGEVIGATEVALNPAEVAAAQTDINVFPTPVQGASTAGPDWVQIGTEGGFLPAPTVVDGQQPTTWIIDPTRFDVGNVDKHSLLLAPAERADAIVDFSKYAGQTLILYNDAPAAFPARVASYDYYTGAPDTGAGQIIPGYGPNTRTIMQVKIAGTAAPAFNVTKLQNAFKHHADGSGVFESGQHPIIVGQAAYNSAYGTNFVASGDCTNPAGTNKCDGFARINQQGGDLFRFDNLKKSNPQLKIPLQPKALHDEMNSAAFDEFGRMTANLGLEAVPATPAGQNILLYPYIAPPTEIIDGTNLPKGDLNVQAISDGADGTQIWKITHNGVDTHPIHFHLYDVQILNRVTWDNIIIPTEASELGWKDTIRVSPLEDTIVALRPIIPTLPFEIPNAIRPLSPMAPVGADLDPNGLIVDPAGNVTTVTNALVNFGWEYVYHCHILSHEEMDMMRPVLLALPPKVADGLTYTVTGNGNNTKLTLTWNDNSVTETAFTVQRRAGAGVWTDVGTISSPLNQPNTHGSRSFADSTFRWNSTVYSYQVVAKNTVGYGGAYPQTTVQSISPEVAVIAAPTGLSAALAAGPRVNLTWTDNAANETGFVIQRAVNGGAFTQLAIAPARNNTGSVSYADATVALDNTYQYRVAAFSSVIAGIQSAWSNVATANVSVPSAPSSVAAIAGPNQGNNRSVIVTWTDTSTNESGFVVQRATNAAFTTGVVSTNVAANAMTVTITGLARSTDYYFRVSATNVLGPSVAINASPSPIKTNP